MNRYRVRGKLPNGAPAIVRVDAESEAEAISKAAGIYAESGIKLAELSGVAARALKPTKSNQAVYVGKAKEPAAPKPEGAAVPTPKAEKPAKPAKKK